MEKRAFAFVLPGFFVTDKSPEEIFREDISPEELEKIQELIKETIFRKDLDVDVVIAPFLVPPDQAHDALRQLGEAVFGGEEGNNG